MNGGHENGRTSLPAIPDLIKAARADLVRSRRRGVGGGGGGGGGRDPALPPAVCTESLFKPASRPCRRTVWAITCEQGKRDLAYFGADAVSEISASISTCPATIGKGRQ